MPRWQIAYLAGCLAVVGGSLAYMLCDFGGWPLLMYEPYSDTWLVADTPPTAATMLYPGMLIWGMSGGLVSAALTIVVASRFPNALGDRGLQLVGGWALSASAFCGLYFLWGLWPF